MGKAAARIPKGGSIIIHHAQIQVGFDGTTTKWRCACMAANWKKNGVSPKAANV